MFKSLAYRDSWPEEYISTKFKEEPVNYYTHEEYIKDASCFARVHFLIFVSNQLKVNLKFN